MGSLNRKQLTVFLLLALLIIGGFVLRQVT